MNTNSPEPINEEFRDHLATVTEEGTAISLVLKDQYATLNRIEGYQEKEIAKRQLPPRDQSGRRGGYFDRKSSNNRSRNNHGSRSQGGRDSRSRAPRRDSRPPKHPRRQDGPRRAPGYDDALAATEKKPREKKQERRNFLY